MPLPVPPVQNFVDKVGPVIDSAWLNFVDQQVRLPGAGLTGLPVPINQGGTDAIDAPTALANLGGTSLAAAIAAADLLFLPIIGQTPAEVLAGVVPTNTAFPPLDVRRYGALFNGDNVTAPLKQAIAVAGQTVSGQQGATVTLPTGLGLVSEQLVLPNRVIVRGQNKRGTVLRVVPGFAAGWMFHAFGGTWSGSVYTANGGSMFDSRVESLTIDLQNIAGTGGVLSDAWQDGCGAYHVLFLNFTTSAIKYQNGFGGADQSELWDIEMFGGPIGIDLTTPIGAVAAFKLIMRNCIAASGMTAMVSGVACTGNSIVAHDAHMESCTNAFLIDGFGVVSLYDCDGAGSSSLVTNLLTVAETFTGNFKMDNCTRNGSTLFIHDLRSGGLGDVGSIDTPLVMQGNAVPPMFAGANWSGGEFDGTQPGTGGMVQSFNVTSKTRNSAGNYTILEANARPNANCAPMVSYNLAGASHQVIIVNDAEYNIIISVAGTPTDSSEVKFVNVRLQ